MVDVTFLLLVFFLCTFQFRQLDLRHEAHLPKDLGGQPGPEAIEKVDLVVRLDASGAPSYVVGAKRFASLPGLRAHLASYPLDTPLTVDMRERTVHQQFMDVYDLCVGLGFEELSVAGTRLD